MFETYKRFSLILKSKPSLKNALTIPKIFLAFFAIVALSLCWGCDTEDELIPSYIHIAEVDLTTNYATHGSSSHKIPDVWVYVNDNQIGAFELPVTLPVLEEGNVKVSIRAGVYANGADFNRLQYPFYEFYTIPSLFLEKEKVDTIRPVFTYRTDNIMLLNNDFEADNNFETKIITSAPMEVITSPETDVFEGSRSVCITLSPENDRFQIGTIDNFEIPTDRSMFLEFNYKATADFGFFVAGTTADSQIFLDNQLFIFPQENWNKLYINLAETAFNAGFGNSTELGFQAILPDTLSSARFCFDNIKLFQRDL